MSDGDQVISPTLLECSFCIRTGVLHGSSWIVLLLLFDVLAGFWNYVAYCQAEVDYEKRVRLLARADQEVSWLDVSMHIVHAM